MKGNKNTMKIKLCMDLETSMEDKTIGVSKEIFDLLNTEYVSIIRYPLENVDQFITGCKLICIDELDNGICKVPSSIVSTIGLDAFGDVILLSLEGKVMLYDTQKSPLSTEIEKERLKELAVELKAFANENMMMTRKEYYESQGFSGSKIDRPDDPVDSDFVIHVAELKKMVEGFIDHCKNNNTTDTLKEISDYLYDLGLDPEEVLNDPDYILERFQGE